MKGRYSISYVWSFIGADLEAAILEVLNVELPFTEQSGSTSIVRYGNRVLKNWSIVSMNMCADLVSRKVAVNFRSEVRDDSDSWRYASPLKCFELPKAEEGSVKKSR